MKRSLLLYLLIVFIPVLSISAADRLSPISKVESVKVTTPVGTAPRLPWQVWVTYKNGKSEWRQVRWTNSDKETEQQQADATVTPAGTQYVVRGYVIGDNTTSQGFPVDAHIEVIEETSTDISVCQRAVPLPLTKVRLTGNNRLTGNRDLDTRMLLSLDVTQQLYNYRATYGLSTEGYTVSDGWDSPTTKLKGHGTGHYLSALAFAFAGVTDEGLRHELRSRIRRMVDELRQCQERTYVWSDSLGRYYEARDLAPESELRTLKGTWKDFDSYSKDYIHYGKGYLNAIPAQHCILVEMYRPYNNEEWVWAPYYTVHKQLAGLIDVAENIDDKFIADKALLIAKDMGLWVWNRLHYRTYVKTDGTQAERRAVPGNRYEMWNMYIAGEVGGMAESLSRLAEKTSGEESAHLIEAASYFDAPAFFDPLEHNIDDIRTRHANQHIPMTIGALRSYLTNGNPRYYHLARNFWDMIQGRYVYATGGVGNGEMWRQPYTQIASMNTNTMSDATGRRMPNPDLNETCCAYNLAKLTKDLNCFSPDDARYMDYYERVMYNQIVGSIHPTRYGVTYQYAVGLNASKPFGNATPQESCCGGTGAENHQKYQEAAYFVSISSSGSNSSNASLGSSGANASLSSSGANSSNASLGSSGAIGSLSSCAPVGAQASKLGANRVSGASGNATLWVALYLPTVAEWDAAGVTITQECQWPAEMSRIVISKATADSRFAMKLRVPYWATAGFEVFLNGKRIAKDCKPCSYYEIPQRQWHEGDVVEILMPYQEHLYYGPDKMDMAYTNDVSSGLKAFAPMWVGAVMNGPLVMTATDITTWEQATLDVTQTLPDLSGMTPDYEVADNSITHYFRLKLPAISKKKGKTDNTDYSVLTSLIASAKQRQQQQQTWEALSVKVPEYAPWAKNGFQRMMDAMKQAESLMNTENDVAQNDIDYAASVLNVAIISMRPGNLAEPEDLQELLMMIERLRSKDEGLRMQDAIRYARMVVRYVNDGSGTPDMIQKAKNRLSNEVVDVAL